MTERAINFALRVLLGTLVGILVVGVVGLVFFPHAATTIGLFIAPAGAFATLTLFWLFIAGALQTRDLPPQIDGITGDEPRRPVLRPNFREVR